jgi:dephospho-CoA kinase
MTKIVLVVGLPGSGKSTVANYIRDNYNARIFLSGDIIREEIKRRGLAYTPENDSKIAHWFHTSNREGLVVKRLWANIRKSGKKLVVIDGLRSETQLSILRKIAKTRPFVISIVASQNVRVRRELSRGRFGKKESVKYVKFRDKLEKSHGVARLMAKSDYKINNTHLSVRQSNYKIAKIMGEILAN